ncbi:MFS transporter [Paractinoplanes atraurantiacus]|uniref:Transmembrane secretion effector n=1 Tax=Paractinoplanes atraurantiacus TaxID=1036182 RepID=A0A285JPX1_9ACTN|nr:MFS transporter [Actinoplanes atraurantiacus]SNY61376.1 Transmembrane secretion effector [Actinoplanes atraurantiacus]
MELFIDRRPLRIPAFRRLWTASAVTAVGGSFSLIAVPTQLFTLTGSSALVGMSAAVSLATLVVSALWSGALADAIDRRRLLLAGNGGLGLAYLGLWLNAALGLDSIPLILIMVGVQSVSLGAGLTAMGAAVPRVVPAEQLVAANSLSSLTRYGGAVAGPLLAGVLIPVTGLGTLYLLDCLALGLVLWAVARLPPMPAPAAGATGTLRRLGDGFRYLAGRRVLIAILAVDLAAMVFALPHALLPEVAERTYGGPAGGGTGLGLLFAAYPAGVLLAALLSGTFSRARRHGALMASAAMAWGGCVVMLGLAANLTVAVVALALGGAVNFVLSAFRNAISQAHTDDALRGRIQGSLTVVLMGGPQLANMLHGFGGAVLGARPAIVAGGALTVLTVALLLRGLPELWRYGR